MQTVWAGIIFYQVRMTIKSLYIVGEFVERQPVDIGGESCFGQTQFLNWNKPNKFNATQILLNIISPKSS